MWLSISKSVLRWPNPDGVPFTVLPETNYRCMLELYLVLLCYNYYALFASLIASHHSFVQQVGRKKNWIVMHVALTLMPSKRDRARRGLRARSVRRDLMAVSSE